MQEAMDVSGSDGLRIYIPHHALAADKKFRVVFNGSAASSTAMTFNETQCAGPRLQGELFELIHQFRRGKIAMSGDIKKMFRQVRIAPEQYDKQRIFWRESPKHLLKEYQLTVVTYGLKCSPYLSVKAMQQCGKDHAGEFPMAARAIANKFYMDDYLDSVDTLEEAQETRKQVEASLRKGGFELTKWAASDPAVLKMNEQQAAKDFGEEKPTSVLGLRWQPSDDMIKFNIRKEFYDERHVVMKRVVASEGARLYGYLSPAMIVVKMIVQDIWREGPDWEEPVSSEISHRWQNLRQDILNAAYISIPRWIGMTATTSVQLHVFCDASKRALGVAMYTRIVENTEETAMVRLVMAQSKVAPRDVMSIPRLELEACKIGAKSAQRVAESFGVNPKEIRYWTDSEVCLWWLRKSPHEQKVFVSHRVAQVQELTDTAQWSHVPSEHNPADMITRGMTMMQLKEAKAWWEGPAFLASAAECWPKWTPDQSINVKGVTEMIKPKVPVLVVLAASVQSGQDLEMILDTHSSMRAALRITAYVMRYIK